jgi:tyrosyl-tRNA synthetase
MSRNGKEFIAELRARHLVQLVTDEEGLSKLLTDQVVPVYAGYDPTSSSLHVGNLVPTILLKRFQLAGHKPIVLVGGATGMVGDPSGKSDERNLLDDTTLQNNLAGIRSQLSRLLDFDDKDTGALMTNNADWTRPISFLEFLRDYGKYLTVNYMMAKDSVSSRLESESGISYTEFSYMLLQAMDFVHLNKAQKCRLQVGGSDQYGNITAGCEMSRKMGGPQLYGLSAPLLLDSTGQKMGKTSTGERIWLDPQRTSAYKFYQYWLNRADDEAPRFLREFSMRPLDELDEVIAEHDRDRSKRVAQRELAVAMTSWVHGKDSIARVESASKVMFGGDLDGVTDEVLGELLGTLPVKHVTPAALEAGISILDLLIRTVCDSKGEARRLVTQGGAYINNKKITDPNQMITKAHLATPKMIVVRSGKKDYCLLEVVDTPQ